MILLLYSCGLTGASNFRLFFPDRPLNWPTGQYTPAWLVKYIDYEGQIQSVTVDYDSECLIAFGRVPYIIAAAWPEGDYRPAGICAFADDGEYTFSWLDGAAADFFLSLTDECAGFYDINVPLVARKFRECGGCSPWLVDSDRLKPYLLTGTLNGNLFRKKDSWDLGEEMEDLCGCWDPYLQFRTENGILCMKGRNVFYASDCKITLNACHDGWTMLKVYGNGFTDVSSGCW
ncbi:MAG: hypothetical protein JW874_01850 [Spirochaetales bacterium]|nr:hypothetical protein [Spirochaetales bacterium]